MQSRRGLRFSFGAAGDASSLCSCGFLEGALDWLRSGGDGLGWFDLPDLDSASIMPTAEWLRTFDSIIHVGIGGSALGNLMLNQALLPEFYNELRADKRGPRFYLADNPDPQKANAIWEQVRGSRCALVGVSKSGATAETMSQFLWFRSKIQEECGAADDRILVITDPEKGVFRAFASETGCRSLEIPSSVGGRYSVLSAGGLVSAAALGIDIQALLAGAAAMRAKIISTDATANPAYQLAALHYYHEKLKRPMVVLMPYSSRLERFAEWFAQLWAESIGKDGKGTTPIRALGAIDQHSQVQLYTDGPDDKLYTLIYVKNHGVEISVPAVADTSLEPLAYLFNQKMGEMLGFEAKSTAAALIKAGHPVVWIEMDEITSYLMGQLIFFYECVTALTGRLMGVNPFDQPGVEQGKRYTYGFMGRDGYKPHAEEATSLFGKIEQEILEF